MIICPSCKEEIEEHSYYCDQCGQALLYCCSCGRVGVGRHCTYCGGLMRNAQDIPETGSMPMLTLDNAAIGIRIVGINGAVIGRKHGPYKQFFEQNRYVSGMHAQLLFDPNAGWCVVDKHSSNGTRLNNNPLQPNAVTPLKNGDMIAIANVNLSVGIV